MGTTARFGITYPELSALPDAPAQMQSMAQTVDDALGEAVDDVAGLTSGRTGLERNGSFEINQRGSSSYTATGASGKYTVDGWYIYSGTGATNIITPTAETAGAYADHGSKYLAWNRSVAGSADSYLAQQYEDVRTANGSSITVAIRADVASSAADVKVQVVQVFGSGGSSDVVTTSSAITLDTSTTPQYVTVAVPSVSGKTIGSGADHYLEVRILREFGGGTGTIRLRRVGITRGTAQVFPDRRQYSDELCRCQRYYYRIAPGVQTRTFGHGMVFSSTLALISIQMPVKMRTTPTADFSGTPSHWRIVDPGSGTATTVEIGTQTQADCVVVAVTCSGGGLTAGRACWLDNFGSGGAAAYLGFAAELR